MGPKRDSQLQLLSGGSLLAASELLCAHLIFTSASRSCDYHLIAGRAERERTRMRWTDREVRRPVGVDELHAMPLQTSSTDLRSVCVVKV
jgi:hypothetical protein